MTNCEVVIIGGGLAGLISGIHLSKIGRQVTVIEKNSYPKHKVCGEYISNEVLSYFEYLDLHIEQLHPTEILNLEFSTADGKNLQTKLPLGGFGISRFTLDHYLYSKALEYGCHFIFDTVNNIHFDNDLFAITMQNNPVLQSKIVLGAFGKRSNIDVTLNRNFIGNKSNWLGVKAHYSGTFKNDVVGLHNFMGGYCGVSKVENNVINICYLTNYKSFKKYKNPIDFQNQILNKNANLKSIFEDATMIFDKPLTISQISFDKKEPVENHILMIGDTAGLIHPLCGNGMAMAIHSAKIASELVNDFTEGRITNRTNLELRYKTIWNQTFKKRLQMGRFLGLLLQKPKLASIILRIFVRIPFLLPIIIKKTHGKSF